MEMRIIRWRLIIRRLAILALVASTLSLLVDPTFAALTATLGSLIVLIVSFVEAGPNQAVSRLRIFLCYTSTDKVVVRELYHRLRADGFAPWLDEEALLPGQKWQVEIPKAVRIADVVLICLSRQSVNKTGYVQKEIKFALDVADEQPEGAIFLIPLRLEECEVPGRLSHLQWVNLFDEGGYALLFRALRQRADSLGLSTPVAVSTSLSASQQFVKREPIAPVTEDGRASLQRQLSDLRGNLTLIEERKAEYVLTTDIPLQLVKDERRLKEQIVEVEQRLSASSFTAPTSLSAHISTGDSVPPPSANLAALTESAPAVSVEFSYETIVRSQDLHEYFLAIRVKNEGATAVASFKLQFTFPDNELHVSHRTYSPNHKHIMVSKDTNGNFLVVYQSIAPLFPGDEIDLTREIAWKYKVDDTIYLKLRGQLVGIVPIVNWTFYADNMQPLTGSIPLSELNVY